MQLSAKQTGQAEQHPMLECAIRIGFPVGCCVGRSDRGKCRHKLTNISGIGALPNFLTHEDPCERL